MKSIDLNCDLGELPEMLADGTQEELMRYISSANVACGGHAGSPELIRATLEQARRHHVRVGAHPGYDDPINFGRTDLRLSPTEITDLVYRQVVTVADIAAQCDITLAHVKAHGALYNEAAKNPQIACAIAAGVRQWSTHVILVGLAGSLMLHAFANAGFTVAAEAFADRRYESDGTLRSRKYHDAVIDDPDEAADQALRIATDSQVVAVSGATAQIHADTICLHGDSPEALAIAAAVHHKLTDAGIAIGPVTR